MNLNSLGRHILVELYGCSAELLCNVAFVETSMIQAAQKAQATVLNSTFHHFTPLGVSGVVVIQESHLAIHTWPEYNYAAVDIFTCSDSVDPWQAFIFLKEQFKASHTSAMEILRGTRQLIDSF